MKLKPRFAILARVSTREQIDGHSLEVQQKLCTEYVAKCGGTVAVVYSAQESATTEDRKTLPKVLSNAGSVFTDLVFEEPTRLSRNPATMFAAITELAKAGVRVHTIRGVLDSASPEGEFQLMIESVVGRFTARQGVRKSINARLHVLRNGGIAAGRPPWGRVWNKAERRFEIIPDRQRQIRTAFDLIVNRRQSLAQAGSHLKIAASSLRKAINQAALVKITQELQGEQFEIKCPALLSSIEQWRVLKRLKENRVVRPTLKGEYLLQGLVRCSACGAHMTGQTSIKGKLRYSVYRHPPKTVREGCTWAVPVQLLDGDVLTACAETVKSGAALRDAIKAELAQRHGDASTLEQRRRELTESIKQQAKQLDGLVDALAQLDKGRAHELTTQRIKRVEASLKADESELEQVIAEVRERDRPDLDADEIAAKLRALYWAGGKPGMTLDQKRAFVRTIIGMDKELGVFVRMHRRKDGSKKDVFWRYTVRGLVASMGNYLDRGDDATYPTVAPNAAPRAAVQRLAAIAGATRGIHGVQSGIRSSSGA